MTLLAHSKTWCRKPKCRMTTTNLVAGTVCLIRDHTGNCDEQGQFFSLNGVYTNPYSHHRGNSDAKIDHVTFTHKRKLRVCFLISQNEC